MWTIVIIIIITDSVTLATALVSHGQYFRDVRRRKTAGKTLHHEII